MLLQDSTLPCSKRLDASILTCFLRLSPGAVASGGLKSNSVCSRFAIGLFKDSLVLAFD